MTPTRLAGRSLVWRNHEVPAALAAGNQALLPQDPERALGRALGDLVLLLQALYARQPTGQLAALDLPAQHCSQLDVQRRHRIMIEIHMITLGNLCADLRFQMSIYGHRWTHMEVAGSVPC
jgi:hypothetical protein